MQLRGPLGFVLANLLILAVAIGVAMALGSHDPNPAPPDLRAGGTPIGQLGYPLGEYLTIEGYRVYGPSPEGSGVFRVDTINGTKLPSPVGVLIEKIDLPEDARCTIKGYESLRMVGDPPAVRLAADESGQHRPALKPTGFRVGCHFVPLRFTAPDTPRHLRSDPAAAIQAVLPAGWAIKSVEDRVSPDNPPNGKIKVIHLVAPQHVGVKEAAAYDAAIYIMPAEYKEGTDAPTDRQAQHSPARLIITTPEAKVYLWPGESLLGWPTCAADLFKALVDDGIALHGQATP